MLSEMNVDLPEVPAMSQAARFFKKGEQTIVEISFVGSKDKVEKKVTPEIIAKFKTEFDAFCDGRAPERRKGTPLTDVMPEAMAEEMVRRNVHNGEELAMLSDGQCQGLGHGILTFREQMRKRLRNIALEQQSKAQERIKESQKTIMGGGEEAAKHAAEMEEVKADVAALKDGMSRIEEMLMAMSQKPKRGRPPKEKSDG